MALKAILDALDSVPEPQRPLYRQVTEGDFKDKFVLDVEAVGDWALEHIGGLKSTLAKTQDELTTVKSASAGFAGLKLQPSTIAEKLKRLEALEKLDPETEAGKLAAAKIEAATLKLAETHAVELSARDGTIGAYRGQIEALLVDNELTTAVAKHNGIGSLLTPALRPRIKVTETDGKFGIAVLSKAGVPDVVVKEGKVMPMTIDDLVVSMKADPDFGVAFRASGASGSGAKLPAAGGALGGKNPFLKESFNLTEQSKLKRSDPTMYEAMKAQAGV
ncbi:hypothetical protein ACJ4V0_15630 [Phreatobacter sp. HK31-P]